ncbi:MAG: hypothetical protein ABIW47_15750, partial [Ginsengibacter sp.]
MHILKVITTIFLLLTIWGCKRDLPIQSPENQLYTPYLTSIRNDAKVTLKWGKPFCVDFDCSQLDPDHFEVLMSDTDPSKLKKHTTVSNNQFEITINNLTNGKPYYFAIKAVGSNAPSTISRTIMTIPDHPEKIQTLFEPTNKDRQFGAWSPDQSNVAYVSDYIWNNGNNGAQSVFISTPSNNKEWLVEKNARSPEWSPTGEKIVYHTENGEVNTSQGYRPAHIAIYTLQDSIKKRLTSGNS